MTVSDRVAATALWLARRHLAHAVEADRTPRPALAALAVSAAALLVTAVLGPSAAVEPLPGHPPFGWHAHPPAGAVTALLALAVVAGSYGVGGCLSALRRGWAPDARRLLLGGAVAAVAFGVLAPIGSSDPGSYAAYGRLAATGHDPYVTPPSALTGSYRDIAEDPWRTTTSVYGPVATAEQRFFAQISGNDPDAPAHTVFLLDLTNSVAFVASALLLHRLSAGQAGRRRAAVLFSANPLVLFEGVAGAHIDVLLTFLLVGAVAMLASRRRPQWLLAFAAGVLGGAAAGVKASAALAGAGFAWATGRERHGSTPRLVALALGAAAVLVPGYLLAGGHAFDQLRHASSFVSFADPWRIVTHPLEALLGHDTARAVIRAAAWVAFAVFVVLLNRGLPGRRQAGQWAGEHGVGAARAALVMMLAWLLTAPYVLPWYAIAPFALLALVPASGFDRLLIFWTAVLGLAYLPGRQIGLPDWLHGTVDVWKSGIAPVLLFGAAVAAGVLSVRRRA
jgi:hypothetical protein